MPANHYSLFGHPISMPTYKVALMLTLCSANVEWNEVDITTAEFRRGERSADFLAISRFGQVPALRDESSKIMLVQSNAILLYLAEQEGMFMRAENAARWRVNEWLFFEAGRLFEGFAGVRFLSRFAGGNPLLIENYRQHAERQLGMLDQALQATEWLVGQEPSVADISVYSLTSYAPEIDVDLPARFPSVASWHDRFRQLPRFVTAEHALAAFSTGLPPTDTATAIDSALDA